MKVEIPNRIPVQAIREFARSCNCEVRYKNGEMVFVDVSNVVRNAFVEHRQHNVNSKHT